jgi:hypothetical protein
LSKSKNVISYKKHLKRQRDWYAETKLLDEVWLCSYCSRMKHASQFHKRYKCKLCHNKHERIYARNTRPHRKMLSVMRKYNMTEEKYRNLDKACVVCGSKKILQLDHNHKNGKFRGVLCHKCNTALGCVNDDIDLLKKLISYVKENK